MQMPQGVSLLLVGSGLYWILSGRLISSFTVLSPFQFQSLPKSQTIIAVVGIIALAAGLWNINVDVAEFHRLAAAREGYVFMIPIIMPALDVYSTLANLSLNDQLVELNPFVASAVQFGPTALVPFLVSYIALSEGLALLMLRMGRWLFKKTVALRFLSFSMVCGASSFAPFSNILGIALGYDTTGVYAVAAVMSTALAAIISRILSPLSLRGVLLRSSLIAAVGR